MCCLNRILNINHFIITQIHSYLCGNLADLISITYEN